MCLFKPYIDALFHLRPRAVLGMTMQKIPLPPPPPPPWTSSSAATFSRASSSLSALQGTPTARRIAYVHFVYLFTAAVPDLIALADSPPLKSASQAP